MKHTLILAAAILCAATVSVNAQSVSVTAESRNTYGFSDPNPVPQTQGIYPYFRYETFASQGKSQDWKVVVLENDYIRVKIFPEIGGKIWSIYDKTQDKELFYDNDAVKFRDISLRGAWTSGGIEWNYGVIGHAPSCSFPVDYMTVEKEDGSVSCYVGVSELLTRTRWTIEINLPKDAAYVRTSSFWHNGSGVFQPYYTWANSGVKISDDMKIIYPADYTIEHWGPVGPYPIDEQGRDLSIFANQAHGMDKSYHAGGSHKGYFGAFWPSEEFGMLHYAQRDEKLGRKYFSWAQSEQGTIWIDLLTDKRPQYVELQSGRLYNQNLPGSEKYPYKQFLFTPFATDTWTEYWMPFSHISNVDEVTPYTVISVEADHFDLYSIAPIKGTLVCADASGKAVAKFELDTKATEVTPLGVNPALVSRITINGLKIWTSESQSLDRPNTINPEYDDQSAQGQTIYAKYDFGTRKYKTSEEFVDKALAIDPAYIPALNLKAMLQLRKTNYEAAYEYANKVLAIDTYDAEANYISGLAAKAMGKLYNALDRFEMAALTTELRGAAYTEIAKVYFADGEVVLASQYAAKALLMNGSNISALEILYQVDPKDALLEAIKDEDPLCHFPAIEDMIAGKISADELAASINEEMRFQNYIEAAAFYHDLGLDEKAAKVLAACPDANILTALWEAYVKGDASAIAAAESKPMDFIFPFREETVAVLNWAVQNGGSWKSKYLLSMLMDFLCNRDAAVEAIKGVESNYAPMYSYRAAITGSVDDMKKALSLDPNQWRYVQALAVYYINKGAYADGAKVCEAFYKKHKDNFRIAETYVRCLMALGEYAKADKIMAGMNILPFEGQSATRVMYHDIKVHLAAVAIDAGRYKDAAKYIADARLWPTRLGAGKPYDDLCDTHVEDWLQSVLNERLASKKPLSAYSKVVPQLESGNIGTDAHLF